MKRILLTNDDGYESSGLRALKEAIKDLAHITIVAPSSEKSACGHGLSITKPLKLLQVDDDFYKLDDGTPSDCVYLALHTLYTEDIKPDLVISGINIGSNMGEDITYSGTVAGAIEGCLHGISSIAISQVLRDKNLSQEFDFRLAKNVIRDLAERILTNSFPLTERKFLNVNIPSAQNSKGYKITQMGCRVYGNDALLHRNPRGEEYYWIGLHPLIWESRNMAESALDFDGMNDFDAIKEGFVSVTPIKLDLTSYEDIARLEDFLKTTHNKEQK